MEGYSGQGMVVEVTADHLREVVHVDDDFPDACGHQLLEDQAEHGPATHLHQGLGHLFGQGIEPGAQSGRENHRLHGNTRYLILLRLLISASSLPIALMAR